MNTHTPGPWTVGFENYNKTTPCVRASGLIICTFLDEPFSPDGDERFQNAHLISASPDLLAIADTINQKYTLDKPDQIALNTALQKAKQIRKTETKKERL